MNVRSRIATRLVERKCEYKRMHFLSLTPAQASWPLAAASCSGVDMDHLSPARTLALAAIRSCTCRAGKGEPAGGVRREGWIEWGGTTGKGVKSQ